MKKTNLKHKSYTKDCAKSPKIHNPRSYKPKSSISALEYSLITAIKNTDKVVFSVEDVAKLLKRSRGAAAYLLYRMTNKGTLVRIRRNIYALAEGLDVFEIATRIVWPSYLSFWTALSIYKLTEQLPSAIYVATTKGTKPLQFANFKIVFVRLDRKRFFGYITSGKLQIAEVEKALIDSLLLSRYAGGIVEVYKCLCHARHLINTKKLVIYALRMKNNSLLKRLGYLLERAKLKVSPSMARKLKKGKWKGFSKLDPRIGKSNVYERDWGLILNVSTEELESWRRVV